MNNKLMGLINNQMFAEILDGLSEYIYIVDNNGKILFINKAAARFERVSKTDIIGKHINEIYVQEESPTLKALESGKNVEEHENTYIIDGKEFQQMARSAPLFDGEEVIGAYTLQRDITLVKEIISDNINHQKEAFFSSKKQNKTFESLIGEDLDFKKSIEIAKIASQSNAAVLLAGDTGSGKEIFAKSIHYDGNRKDQPFLAINCAALPEGLFESILFGTTKGSFTGSIDKQGLFEQAKGGTLFLDEINSMPLNSQAKLLRALEEKEIRRVGGAIDIKTDVRIISSINTTPTIAIEKKQLREDLFYRLSVISIIIPPIYKRKADIKLLTSHFIKKYNKKYGRHIQALDEETEHFFMTFNWPGNVRQLKHVIESAVSTAEINNSLLSLGDLPSYLFEKRQKYVETYSHSTESNKEKSRISAENVFKSIEESEKEKIINALILSEGNVSKAARHLNINRQTLVYRMKKHNIKR